MIFKDLSSSELLNINGGKKTNWLKIVGTGIFTVGATAATGGLFAAGASIASGTLSIVSELKD